MKWKILILLAIGFGIQGCSSVQITHYNPNDIASSTCPVNKDIVVIRDTDPLIHYSRLAFASYDFDTRIRSIVMNVKTESLPFTLKEFIFYHECGHHELAHVADNPDDVITSTIFGGLTREETAILIANENAADCYAANMIAEKYGVVELHNVADLLKKHYGIEDKRVNGIKSCIENLKKPVTN